MNRLSQIIALTTTLLAACFDGLAQELTSSTASAACSVLSGNYEVYGRQLSGPDLGNTTGPSLILHVFPGFKVHRPGTRSEAIKISLRDQSHLSIAAVDRNKDALAEDEALGQCEGESFVFSKTTTGGSEGYYGTTTWTVRLSSGPNRSLVANVETNSKGRDFFVFPRTVSLAHSFMFSRAEQ